MTLIGRERRIPRLAIVIISSRGNLRTGADRIDQGRDLMAGYINVSGKRRLNFADFTTKERVNSPVASRYHVDLITHVNLMTGKLSA